MAGASAVFFFFFLDLCLFMYICFFTLAVSKNEIEAHRSVASASEAASATARRFARAFVLFFFIIPH